MNSQASGPSRGFSLTEGGPTYLIEKRVGLIRENSPRIVRSAYFAILITWVPLLVLSALQQYRDRTPCRGTLLARFRRACQVPS
jgi:hypothetical protein